MMCSDSGGQLDAESTIEADYELLLIMCQNHMLMKNVMQWAQNNHFVLYQNESYNSIYHVVVTLKSSNYCK